MVPLETNHSYKAFSAANQSASGEPSGLPLACQCSYANFATSSCWFSPKKSGVKSGRRLGFGLVESLTASSSVHKRHPSVDRESARCESPATSTTSRAERTRLRLRNQEAKKLKMGTRPTEASRVLRCHRRPNPNSQMSLCRDRELRVLN
jgi:hypothetical protein